MKSVSETFKNEVKKQKAGHFGMLLGILAAGQLEIMLVGKAVIRAGKGTITTGTLIPPLPLTNFETQKSYQMNLDLMVFIQEIIYLK